MPFECPPAAHAVFAHPQRMLNLTAPGARLRSVEDPTAWTELRHCRICASTFLLHGRGEPRRWLYSVAAQSDSESAALFEVLEDVAEHCAQLGLVAPIVTRYLVGVHEEQLLTVGEALWLEQALARGKRS